MPSTRCNHVLSRIHPAGSLKLHPHLVFETLAYATAFLVTWRCASGAATHWMMATDGGSSLQRRWVPWSAARFLYWFEDPAATLARWHDPAF